MTSFTLDEVLQPVTEPQYFNQYLHRNFRHIPGPPDKSDRLIYLG